MHRRQYGGKPTSFAFFVFFWKKKVCGHLDGPLLVISGGTIFNGGVYGNVDCTTQCNGITVNSGSFSLNGVAIRNNQGKGIYVPNEKVQDFVVNGCKIYGNGIAMDLVNNGTNMDYVYMANLCKGKGC